MLHISLKYDENAHYAVGKNSKGEVLLQVQDQSGVQSRIRLSPAEVKLLLERLEVARWESLKDLAKRIDNE